MGLGPGRVRSGAREDNHHGPGRVGQSRRATRNVVPRRSGAAASRQTCPAVAGWRQGDVELHRTIHERRCDGHHSIRFQILQRSAGHCHGRKAGAANDERDLQEIYPHAGNRDARVQSR